MGTKDRSWFTDRAIVRRDDGKYVLIVRGVECTNDRVIDDEERHELQCLAADLGLKEVHEQVELMSGPPISFMRWVTE